MPSAKFPRRVIVLLGAGLLFCFLGAALRPGPPRLRRFVSKPLADGTRYTFEYPDYLTTVSEDGPGADPEVTHSAGVNTAHPGYTPWDHFRRYIGQTADLPGETIAVVVMPARGKHLVDGRRSEQWVRGNERRHNEYIDDARTQTQFWLYYSCPAHSKSVYQRNHDLVGASLQVLPPGAPVPGS